LRHLLQRRAGLTPAGECTRDALLQLRRLEVAGDGDDQAVCADLFLVIALQIRVLDRREACFAAVDWSAVGMSAEQMRLAVDRRERRKVGLLCRANEFDLARAQGVELLLLQLRPLQHVSHQLDHELLIAREE